jgi:hypothetical protein
VWVDVFLIVFGERLIPPHHVAKHTLKLLCQILYRGDLSSCASLMLCPESVLKVYTCLLLNP